jgi:hypothetical protein
MKDAQLHDMVISYFGTASSPTSTASSIRPIIVVLEIETVHSSQSTNRKRTDHLLTQNPKVVPIETGRIAGS